MATSKLCFNAGLALIGIIMLQGCVTTKDFQLNEPFLKNSDDVQPPWSEVRDAIVPQLKVGIFHMNEAGVRKLFAREPNSQNDYIDSFSMQTVYAAVMQIALTQNARGNTGAMQILGPALSHPPQPIHVRGLIWSFNHGKEKDFKTPISDLNTNISDNQVVIAIFIDDELRIVHAMSTVEAAHYFAWTSERLINYGTQAALYAVPAIILAAAVKDAAKTFSDGLTQSADRLGVSVDGLTKSLDTAGPLDFGKVNSVLENFSSMIKNGNFKGNFSGPGLSGAFSGGSQ